MTFDNRKLLQSLAFILTIGSFTTSCTHESDMLATFPEVCFENDVLPVFKNSCGMAGCHDAGGESGYVLTSYDGIKGSVVAGNPDASPSYKSIILNHGEGMMPPGQTLSQANRTTIRLWIYQGANNTTCAVPYNAKACFTRDILPVLISSCASTGCNDVASHKEGLIYTSYANTMGSVTAGTPGNSKLYEVITNTSGESRMPLSSSLTACKITQFSKWITNGYPNN